MKKSKKIIILVSIIAFAALVVAGLVCHSIWPAETKQYINTAWEWLNKPLPVVGVSTLMILFFLWRVFAGSSFGKKQILEFKREAEDYKTKYLTLKEYCEEKMFDYEAILKKYEDRIHEYDEFIKKVCEISRNAKIKELGEKFYGGETKETVDHETKAN